MEPDWGEKMMAIKDFLPFVLMQGDDQTSIFAAAREEHKLIHLDDHKKKIKSHPSRSR